MGTDRFLIEGLIDSRKEILYSYSQYRHLRGIDKELIWQATVRDRIKAFGETRHQEIDTVKVQGKPHLFLYELLPWDSEFNEIPSVRLEYILFTVADPFIVSRAVRLFLDALFRDGDKYVFFQVPCEDIFVLQVLGMCGFRLIETRINQYFNDFNSFDAPRWKVRSATESDAFQLGEIARYNVNPYDRLHADICFTKDVADRYIQTFAENAVRGYCDTVLVPDEPNVPIKALLAANLLDADSAALNCRINRLALAVVDPACKGWFKKLVSEYIHLSAHDNVDYIMTTTQSANPASFKSVEKLGFKLGSVDHLFSIRRNLCHD